ncbi:MAG: cyclase family protein [Halobacteria archaeon]|nr:cyclase family protein [Halobacteria archaeon]
MQDLTHRVDDQTQTYPGDPDVEIEPDSVYSEDGYRVSRLSLGSHTGTHVDAPSHTEPDGDSLGSYGVESFVFESLRVDCRDLGSRESIGLERLPDLSADTSVDCLVFWTGWDRHWNTDRYLDHPYLSREAAEYCAEHGVAVGTDTLSPDPTPSEESHDTNTSFDAHSALLGEGCLIFENLTNLGKLPERFELRAYPLRLDTDASPVRAVGVRLSKTDGTV